MLILTRRVGETVVIGDNVTVTVLGVKGNQVRLGVNAPKDVAVHREEIYERIKREQDGGPVENYADGENGVTLSHRGHAGIIADFAQRPWLLRVDLRRDGRVVEGAPLLRE